jgi:hypothetical protein
MQPTNLSEVIQHIAKQQQEKLAADIAEAQQKLITNSYDKAASYTTVTIFGGYAGFFAIWQLSKVFLSKQQVYWAALLILISLLSFVLFEVLKMVLATRSIMSRAAVLQLPVTRNDPKRLLKALQSLDEAAQRTNRWFIVAWAVSVGASVVGALAGAAILGYAFISGLAR